MFETAGAEAPRRVVVVDNDAITRAGTRAVLERADEIELVAAIDHAEAMTFGRRWDSVDVAVVDASAARHPAVDQFPGVAVVRSIRARRASEDLTVIVLTGQSLHPGLRRRMWEAGADFFYGRDEGMTEDELLRVVLRPSEQRRMDRAVGELPAALGVKAGTRVNEVIDRLRHLGAEDALGVGGAKKTGPHGERSRWWDSLRAGAGGVDGLTPMKANGDVALDLGLPSVPQLRKFWSAMTKVRDHTD